MEKPFDQELLDLVVWPTWTRPHRKKCGWSHQALKHKLFSQYLRLQFDRFQWNL